jgi:hypothetical protein
MMIMDGRYSHPTNWIFEVAAGKNRIPQHGHFVHDGKAHAIHVDGHLSAPGPDDLPVDKRVSSGAPKARRNERGIDARLVAVNKKR